MSHGPDRTSEPAAFPAAGSPAGQSFETEVLGLLPGLRRYAHSLSRSNSDGEDLLQDCVETVLVRRAQWRGLNLRAWAFTIMTNLYRNGHRRRARTTDIDIDAMPEIAAPENRDDPLERRHMRAALESLSADSRTVLMLVVIEGYSYLEVAAMLDIPIGTVMSRLSRARQQLGERLHKDNVITLRRQK